MATRAGKDLLTRDDWTAAALRALADGGVAAIAVDPLARGLGVSRGSFYWHFGGRDELVAATLDRWERENTTEPLADAVAIADPVQRLRAILHRVYQRPADRIELVLASIAAEPAVAATVARVTETRLALLRSVFDDLGLSATESRQRAWLAYGFYVGHHQLGRNPAVRRRRPKDLEFLVELLTHH